MAANVAVYERLLPPGTPDLSPWPDLVAELEGIASGAGVPLEALVRLQARTELMGGPECSLLGRPGAVAQNWDWHPDVVPLVWVVEQPGGRWFATLTEAGMVGKIGLSSAGLCAGLNFLRCSEDGGLDGVPIHVLLRMLLERVDALDAAVELLTSARVSASSCITVASADEVVAVEVSPGGAHVIRGPEVLHTNHFLDGPPAGTDLEAAEDATTFERLEDLRRTGSLSSPVVCRHDDPAVPWPDRVATLASVVMEPGVPRLCVADGPPCERPLVEVPLP
ncbi:MAG TPA: C45 family peptidase [Solirubrobacteraceae bacterium]|nr:C45 family peptidase [Solirubrobacteraceae bacterium]